MHRVQYCSLQKKKKIAQPSFYRLKRPPKNFKGQSPKYVNYEIKNQQSVVGMGANNRRGNVFELKLDGAEVFYNSSTHVAGEVNAEFRPPIFKWEGIFVVDLPMLIIRRFLR